MYWALSATTEVTLIKATYNGMMMKTHRLQSNRICLQVLSGGLEEEVGHPDRVSLVFVCLFVYFVFVCLFVCDVTRHT